MSRKPQFEKAIPVTVSPERLKRIVNGEISALYLRCKMIPKAASIMAYAKLGQVQDADGGFCPKRGEWLERVTFGGERDAFAHYQSGTLKCIHTSDRLTQTNTYYFIEKAINLADYGLPEHILYLIDNSPNLTIRHDSKEKKVKWKALSPRKYARYFMVYDNIVIKPAMDVTENEALELGFTPTDEPIRLENNLSLLIDDGATARNAFFLDYYSRIGEELRNDPYIYYIKFELIRR